MMHPQDQLSFRGIDPLSGKRLIVRKRDGRHEEFNEARIALAIEAAFRAVEGVSHDQPLADHLHAAVKKSADAVTERVLSRAVRGEQMEVERIQDEVENQLMVDGHLAVARRYILYREKRRLIRAEREGRGSFVAEPVAQSPLDETVPEIHPIPPAAPPPAPPVAKAPPRTLLEKIYSQALPDGGAAPREAVCRHYFSSYIHDAIYLKQLSPELGEFDLETLGRNLRLERDQQFSPAGLQSLHDDFLLRVEERCLETPQYFWMRVAMGLALNEGQQLNSRALEFYEALSTFRFVPAESVLCHAGTTQPHLLTCYTSTSWSDLEHVTAHPGARMTHRAGLTCSWLEPWHSGIWDFLQRPRPGEEPWSHDLNKGLWISDLFMKRVRARGLWTLFNPVDVPDLHQLHGRAFEARYAAYEEAVERGEIRDFKLTPALDLWQEILASLAQTGQPWLGFKDAANVRSRDGHAGAVHSANLGTEILLNAAANEPVTSSLGAINLASHVLPGSEHSLDLPLLQQTVDTALRMLDNAIDLSEFPSASATQTCREHRSAGLGITGFQDALDRVKISYASAAGTHFADRSMELISYYAILASANLAQERGCYPNYTGSKWSLGLLPMDTMALLASERGVPLDVDLSSVLDWDPVRDAVRSNGMRNCSVTAIAPLRESAKLIGASPSIEPSGEIGAQWLIESAARRQKWIDMSQSLPIYSAEGSPAFLSEIYMQGWEKGLKTIRQFHLSPRLPQAASQPETARQTEAVPQWVPGVVSVK